MNTKVTKNWTIEIDEKDVFARCTNESLYQSYVRSNNKEDAIVMQDDDYGQFHVYFTNAVANLHILLARRMYEPPYPCGCDEDRKIIFDLYMHDNHDDNMIPILTAHCYDYIVKQILEQWFHADLGSQLARLEINHCLHYRKNPVRRRIDPLF